MMNAEWGATDTVRSPVFYSAFCIHHSALSWRRPLRGFAQRGGGARRDGRAGQEEHAREADDPDLAVAAGPLQLDRQLDGGGDLVVDKRRVPGFLPGEAVVVAQVERADAAAEDFLERLGGDLREEVRGDVADEELFAGGRVGDQADLDHACLAVGGAAGGEGAAERGAGSRTSARAAAGVHAGAGGARRGGVGEDVGRVAEGEEGDGVGGEAAVAGVVLAGEGAGEGAGGGQGGLEVGPEQ